MQGSVSSETNSKRARSGFEEYERPATTFLGAAGVNGGERIMNGGEQRRNGPETIKTTQNTAGTSGADNLALFSPWRR